MEDKNFTLISDDNSSPPSYEQVKIEDREQGEIIIYIEQIGNIFQIDERILVKNICDEIKNKNHNINKNIIFYIFVFLKEKGENIKKVKSLNVDYLKYKYGPKFSRLYNSYLDLNSPNDYLSGFFYTYILTYYNIIENIMKNIN